MRIKLFALLLSLSLLAPLSLMADEVAIPTEEPEADKAQAQPQTQSAEAKPKDEEVFFYTIVPHDTLWDISGRFLKNPFKWPKIWKLNPYIKNPDLIYPGNVVKVTPDGIEIIGRKEAEAEKLPTVELGPEEEKVVVLEPEEEKKEEAAPLPPPAPQRPKVESSSIERRGFITGKELDAAGAIIAAKEEKLLVTHGEQVFISFKDRSAVKPGDSFSIFAVGKSIKHPVTKAVIGNAIETLGSLTVTSAGDVVEGRIDTSYKEIEAGARVRAFRPPVTEVEITEPDADVKGFIVAAIEDKENLSQGDIAYIDRGSRDGLKKGNIMRIFREAGKAPDPLSKGKLVTLPPIELGTLVVLDADENTSSCVVVKSLKPINWGDSVATVRAD